MFNCGKGKHRFSETGYCELFGQHGSFKEYEQMSKLTCYGLSVDAIADVLLKGNCFPHPTLKINKKTLDSFFYDKKLFLLSCRKIPSDRPLIRHCSDLASLLRF